MADEYLDDRGRTVLVLDADEAAVVCGPNRMVLYLHQDADGPVDSEANRTATAMAATYGDFTGEEPYNWGGSDGPKDSN